VLDSVAPPVDTQSLSYQVANLMIRVADLEARVPATDPTFICAVTKYGTAPNISLTMEIRDCGIANGFDPVDAVAYGGKPYPPMRFVWGIGASDADVPGATEVFARVKEGDGAAGNTIVYSTTSGAQMQTPSLVLPVADLAAWIAGGKHVVLVPYADGNPTWAASSGPNSLGLASVTP
jgi:hypothetical protein